MYSTNDFKNVIRQRMCDQYLTGEEIIPVGFTMYNDVLAATAQYTLDNFVSNNWEKINKDVLDHIDYKLNTIKNSVIEDHNLFLKKMEKFVLKNKNNLDNEIILNIKENSKYFYNFNKLKSEYREEINNTLNIIPQKINNELFDLKHSLAVEVEKNKKNEKTLQNTLKEISSLKDEKNKEKSIIVDYLNQINMKFENLVLENISLKNKISVLDTDQQDLKKNLLNISIENKILIKENEKRNENEKNKKIEKEKNKNKKNEDFLRNMEKEELKISDIKNEMNIGLDINRKLIKNEIKKLINKQKNSFKKLDKKKK